MHSIRFRFKQTQDYRPFTDKLDKLGIKYRVNRLSNLSVNVWVTSQQSLETLTKLLTTP